MLKMEIETRRPTHRYQILFEPGLGVSWKQEVEEHVESDSYLVLVDANLARIHGFPLPWTVDGRFRYLWVKPGEEHKNLAQYGELCEQALDVGIDRKTVLVAIGGGVTGDIAGMMAATLLRGIRLAQIPTTLLAQVDSSVGGKNGVNTPAGKNLLGTFYQPELVLIDPMYLDTLPRREYLAGLAEIVKTALLDGPDFFRQLQRSLDLLLAMDHGFIAGAISRCCRFKAEIVAADETEKGKRQLLNLGHTFGHALEALAGYDGRVVHGEAVAVGVVLAAEFSRSIGILTLQEYQEISGLLKALGMPAAIRDLGAGDGPPPDWHELLKGGDLEAALSGDKKTDKGKLTLILPHAIGDCRVEKGCSIGEVADFMRGHVD